MTAEKPKDESETNVGIIGRSLFIIETTDQGVCVQTVFLAEDGSLIKMPAVFPNQEYALNQVEELRLAILKHFNELARGVLAKQEDIDAKGPSPQDTIQ
jgi:transcription termination factor NusB